MRCPLISRAFVASALALAFGGCGGSGTAGSPLPSTPVATAHIVIVIPASAAAGSARKPAYVSPATQSITVQVDSATVITQNLSPSSSNCASAGANYPLDCTVPVSASAGPHLVTFVTYDQLNAAGNKLSANSITVTFVAGQNTAIAVTLAGAPASLQVSPLPGATTISGNAMAGFDFLSTTAQPLIVTALDADGNYIVGPGSPTLTLTISGASSGSGISVGPPSAGNPNEFVINATGFGTATLVLTANPTSSIAGNAVTANIPLTAAALASTIAGTPQHFGFADGTGSGARFNFTSAPFAYGGGGIAYDSNNGALYVTDSGNCAVRQVTTAGVVTTIAGAYPTVKCGFVDGTGTTAEFSIPTSVAYDSGNGDLYTTDTTNCAIRQVTTAGVVTTIAGAYPTVNCGFADGTGIGALFNFSSGHLAAMIGGIAYDSNNGNLYVTDTSNCAVRQVTTAGVVTTTAGGPPCGFVDGTGTSARFNYPAGLTYDTADGDLYVTDTDNCAVRQVTVSGAVSTLAGAHPTANCGLSDGTGTSALFNLPVGIAYDAADGELYVTDTNNCAIRQVTAATGTVTTIVGGPAPLRNCGFVDGVGGSAFFGLPMFLAAEPSSGDLYVTDYENDVVRRVKL